MWIIGSILGSISLIILNTLSKLVPISGTSVLCLGTISVYTTLCFWYAWQHPTSPGFLQLWFIQSGMVTVGALVANHFIVQDKLTTTDLLAIGMIFVGGMILKR